MIIIKDLMIDKFKKAILKTDCNDVLSAKTNVTFVTLFL